VDHATAGQSPHPIQLSRAAVNACHLGSPALGLHGTPGRISPRYSATLARGWTNDDFVASRPWGRRISTPPGRYERRERARAAGSSFHFFAQRPAVSLSGSQAMKDFVWDVTNPSRFKLDIQTRIRGSWRGHLDEKANCNRACSCFLCRWGIFRSGLASHRRTAALSPGSSASSRMDRPLFWSERRLWLGQRIINHAFYGPIGRRPNDPIGTWRDRAR
jgi:hypothetical protein